MIKPYYETANGKLYCGSCEDVLVALDSNSIDTIITDPPYGLNFMGKKWDYDVPSIEIWQECLRVLKPGGTALIFAGSRTQHRMACSVEDAGFILKDCIMYLYGSGFPKSHNWPLKLHEKACNWYGDMVEDDYEETQLDTKPNETKKSRTKGEVQAPKHAMRFVRATYLQTPVYACSECGQVLQPFMSKQNTQKYRQAWTQSKTIWPKQSCMEGRSNLEASKRELFRCEICTLSNRPIADGAQGWVYRRASYGDGYPPWASSKTSRSRSSYRPQSFKQFHKQPNAISVERRAQKGRGWGTALKPAYEPILVCMKPNEGSYAENALKHGVAGLNIDGGRIGTEEKMSYSSSKKEGVTKFGTGTTEQNKKGRYPANIILDEKAAEMLDEQSGKLKSGALLKHHNQNESENACMSGKNYKRNPNKDFNASQGGTSRFFYCAKASKSERNAGLSGDKQKRDESRNHGQAGTDNPYNRGAQEVTNHHPTVKPLKLIEYLCKLTETPTKGIVLDPFAGSGPTGIACERLNRKYILIEKELEYCEIAAKRIENERKQLKMF